MNASYPTPQEQDRALLNHALEVIRDASDLWLQHHPAEAMSRVRSLGERLHRHLHPRSAQIEGIEEVAS